MRAEFLIHKDIHVATALDTPRRSNLHRPTILGPLGTRPLAIAGRPRDARPGCPPVRMRPTRNVYLAASTESSESDEELDESSSDSSDEARSDDEPESSSESSEPEGESSECRTGLMIATGG